MEQQDYRLITKKSAHQLVDEGILVEYIREGDLDVSSHNHRLVGRGRNYTEAFDCLMRALEAWNRIPTRPMYGLCNIIELKEKTLEIILRGDLVIST